MGPVTSLSIYLLIWWIAFIAILPMGSTSFHEAGIAPPPGCDPGAPVNPNMKKKLLLTTAIAAGVFVVFWLVVIFKLVKLPDVARVY